MGRDYLVITAGTLKGGDSDIYVIYSPGALSESARINTIRKAAYRIHRKFFKSPVTIYLSPYKKNYGIFTAKINASCVGGVCFFHGLASTGLEMGPKEKGFISRYYDLAKSRRSFNKDQILPRLYKELGKSKVDKIYSIFASELIFESFFITSDFNNREIESIF